MVGLPSDRRLVTTRDYANDSPNIPDLPRVLSFIDWFPRDSTNSVYPQPRFWLSWRIYSSSPYSCQGTLWNAPRSAKKPVTSACG